MLGPPQRVLRKNRKTAVGPVRSGSAGSEVSHAASGTSRGGFPRELPGVPLSGCSVTPGGSATRLARPGRQGYIPAAMRENIRLVSSAGTGFTYYTTKNKRTQTNKLELKKYDPVARQHVVFKEAKMPPHSK